MIPLFQLMRPKQYVKNIFVFLPIFFGGFLHNEKSLEKALIAFFVFCTAASCIYIINDLRDVKEDKLHPTKRYRPIASGTVSRGQAFLIFSLLLVISLSVSFIFLDKYSFFIIVGYISLNILYVYKLKQIAIVDLFCVAFGFVLRVYMGAFATHVPISSWLVLMVFLLAVFLVTTKRWDDMCLGFEDKVKVRSSLSGYNITFLSAVMQITVTLNLVSYVMYCVSPKVVENFGNEYVYFTFIWVFAGFMRFLQIVYIEKKCPSPTKILYSDRFIQFAVLLWVLHFYWIVYG